MTLEDRLDEVLRNINTEAKMAIISTLGGLKIEAMVKDVREDILAYAQDREYAFTKPVGNDLKRIRSELNFLTEFGTVSRQDETTDSTGKIVTYTLNNENPDSKLIQYIAMLGMQTVEKYGQSENHLLSIKEVIGLRPRIKDGKLCTRYMSLLMFHGDYNPDHSHIDLYDSPKPTSALNIKESLGIDYCTTWLNLEKLQKSGLIKPTDDTKSAHEDSKIAYELTELGRNIVTDFVIPTYRAIITGNVPDLGQDPSEICDQTMSKVLQIYDQALKRMFN